jgi:hypothetical protein
MSLAYAGGGKINKRLTTCSIENKFSNTKLGRQAILLSQCMSTGYGKKSTQNTYFQQIVEEM